LDDEQSQASETRNYEEEKKQKDDAEEAEV